MSRFRTDHDESRDRGMTLPEVLVSVTITGMLVAAMAMATTVILRQADNSRGRINNTRSEQSIGTWMPADLASAEDVSTAADASPCGSSCPPGVNVGGSNALMLSWTGSVPGTTEPIPTQTHVSYRYIQTPELEWQIIRVACYWEGSAAPSCTQVVVLHDVTAPPPGIEYYPGVTQPVWAMLVTLATDPAAPGSGEVAEGEDPTYYVKNGRRVTVSINGGGDLAGAGGGQDTVTLSAGGTNRQTELSTTNLSGAPTFAATRSRCGGNFGLVVDTSGSIGSNMSYVRNGVTAFIDAFAGTPIKLQVVTFATTATTLGAGSSWTKYYDMLVESDVSALKSLVAGLNSTGGTNWEDGMFRMFRNSNGTVQSALPGTMIFFTDGIPTYSRMNATSASSTPVAHPDDSGLPNGTGSSYSQLSWNRANRIAREFEADLERLIGVYVGNDVNGQSLWTGQGAGYHLENFVRAYHWDYQRGSHPIYERGYELKYQRANNGLTFEKMVGSTWTSVSRGTYEDNNTVPGESDGWRARVTGTLGNWKDWKLEYFNASNLVPPDNDNDGFRKLKIYDQDHDFWEEVTQAEYNANNTKSDDSDGWRISTSYTAPHTTWTSVTQSQYNSGNTTADESDGWRAVKVYSSPWSLWEPTTEAIYNANNTTSDASDGFDATKVYDEPYTHHEGTTSYYRPNRDILKQFVAPSGAVPAVQQNGVYTNAAQATYYELPNWSQFSDAMTSLALAECGGTVTVQTKLGATNASDPFTYQNSVDLSTATTSALYRSGTFDYELSSGTAVSATISPMQTSTLDSYNFVGWTCKAAGANYSFTTAPIESGSQWQSISLSVAPNTAVSCVMSVTLK